MERIQKLVSRHVYLCSVLITLLTFCPMFIINRSQLHMGVFLYSFVVRFWPACILIFLMRILGLSSNVTFGIHGLGKGIVSGWIAILFSAGMIVFGMIDQEIRSRIMIPSYEQILGYFFEMFCIGLLEEILARGIIFGLMLRTWYGRTYGVLKAALMSGTLFGMMHLINLLGGAGIRMTLSQVIYASFIGVYFAAVYIRTGNLWSVILLHTLIDMCGSFFDFFQQSSDTVRLRTMADISVFQAVANIIITVPFLIWAIYYSFKVDIKFMEDRLQNNKKQKITS